MPPKPRDPSRTDLPVNLYENAGYFTWRNPQTGQRFGIGRDRADAIEQALEANQYLENAAGARLIEKLESPPGRTVAEFIPIFRAKLEERELSVNTRYSKKSHLKHIEAALGDMEIRPRQEDATAITQRVSAWLTGYANAGKKRTAQALRTTLVDMFAAMASDGWLAVNPAEVIKLSAPKVRRARLTLESFMQIYNAAAALDPWVQRSMELGLVSLQRREDVSLMWFRDISESRLHVEQQKTGMRIRIPTSLRLEAVGWSLDDIIKRCRDDVVSRHMLHHTVHQGKAKPGDGVNHQTITRKFREVRDLAGVVAPEGKTPPTYHELRSLGIRLYKLQGYDPQALAGHKDEATTATYTDVRGAEWIDVAA